MAENAERKQRGRQFSPGRSGNPAGKPKGARNKATLAVEALMEGQATALGRKAVELAMKGDTTALRLCLERIAPVRKGRPVRLDLPVVKTAADIAAAMAALVMAMAAGDVTPDEAAMVAGVLEVRRKALETEELEQRLRALEEKEEKQ